MKNNIGHWILALFWILLGGILWALSFAGKLDNFWYGMSGGLIAVGVIRLVRLVKYSRDSEYREKVDTENRDERNRFISARAWAWAGYIYVFAAAFGTIGFHISGHEDLSFFCSISMCALLVFYYVSWLILRKKY